MDGVGSSGWCLRGLRLLMMTGNTQTGQPRETFHAAQVLEMWGWAKTLSDIKRLLTHQPTL
jgi:hypothetical protein